MPEAVFSKTMTLSKLIAAQLGMPSGMFAGLAALVWNRRNAALNDTVLDQLSLRTGDRVLEVGFGGGYLLSRMARIVTGGLLVGVDRSPAMVAQGERRYRHEIRMGRLELKCAAAESLPYQAEYFTKVCSINSIFYWDDVEQGISEMRRVLTKGGKMVLSFTSHASLENKGFARHIKIIDPTALEQNLIKNGFQEITASTFSDKYRQYVCISALKGS